MVSYLISDNTDTLVGMRLAGITGVILHEKNEVLEEFKKCLSDKNIGILILTEKIFDLIPDDVMQAKLKRKFPLIVEIPDRHGLRRDEDFITKYINESIGISI
jgi:ATP synthase, subunit F